jgi:DNA replication protein DnaC
MLTPAGRELPERRGGELLERRSVRLGNYLNADTSQRWSPEDFLRTLVEAEITARDESNARGRLKAAALPVTKTLDELDVGASSVPKATLDYLAFLEWIAAKENVCLVGPAGTGKSHLLVAVGHSAVEPGRRVRYFTAPELVETLCRGIADNSVGKVIDQLLRADLVIVAEIFAPLDDTGAQLLFRLAAAYERVPLAIASHWPFDQWGQFLPEQTTAPARQTVAPQRRASHRRRVVPHARSPPERGWSHHAKVLIAVRGVRTFRWPPAGTSTWPLTLADSTPAQ